LERILSATVLNASAADATKPALHPAYLAWIHEGALLMIKSGEPADRLPFKGDDLAAITGEMAALKAEGVGPERAAVLLARLKAGGLRAIDGGGEGAPDGQRPLLALVRAL
jgi:hypothetical protein